MRFTTWDGRQVTFENGVLSGNEVLVGAVERFVELGIECGCDYWGERPADLSSDWRAYLTICGTIAVITGHEPEVDRVPQNPDGYEPEGPVLDDTETVQASGRFLETLD